MATVRSELFIRKRRFGLNTVTDGKDHTRIAKMRKEKERIGSAKSNVNERQPTVLLADDHDIVVQGLRRVLETDFDVIGIVADGLALVTDSKRLKPDVIVVDVSMPLLNGIEAARQIQKAGLRAKIVFLSMHPDIIYVSEAFRAGGLAYVLKSSAGIEIVNAIREVLQGRTYVSPSIDKSLLEAQIKRDDSSRDKLQGLSPRL